MGSIYERRLDVSSACGDDEPYVYFFESDPKSAPKYLRRLIKSGAAKLVEINEKDASSILTRLEVFAYAPEAITFVVHRAEQPYLFCLVGENVTNKNWREANKVVTAFQKERTGAGKAGRPLNLGKLKRAIVARSTRGSLKSKATLFIHENSKIEVGQVYLSRAGKKMKEIAT